MPSFFTARSARLGLILVAGLALGACAKNPADDNGLGAGSGVASPGSQQDFIVNVGDKVFFETDSTELTTTAQATLDKQSAWLNRYGR